MVTLVAYTCCQKLLSHPLSLNVKCVSLESLLVIFLISLDLSRQDIFNDIDNIIIKIPLYIHSLFLYIFFSLLSFLYGTFHNLLVNVTILNSSIL